MSASARKLVVVPVRALMCRRRLVLATWRAITFLAVAFSRMRRSKGAAPLIQVTNGNSRLPPLSSNGLAQSSGLF